MYGSLRLSVDSKMKRYSVEFTDSIGDIADILNQNRIITVIDSNVANLYPSLSLKDPIIVECIEDRKNIDGAIEIYNRLIEKRANINTKLVVIGGGILQDLVGFCASTYCRGIDYTLVPTTLLSQADSCIGGKTSLNHLSRKNILGTFYPPDEIIVCPKFIETLSTLDVISGFGEIYKFHILQNKMDSFDIDGDILKMVHDGLEYKISIIEDDEFDRGNRRFLNFGHTFGHSIESISNYKIPHGIAVIVGSIIAMRISKKFGYQNEQYDIIDKNGFNLLSKSQLKFEESWFDFEKLLPLVLADKKSTGKLTMVLMNENKPFVTEIQDHSLVLEVLEEVYASI